MKHPGGGNRGGAVERRWWGRQQQEAREGRLRLSSRRVFVQ